MSCPTLRKMALFVDGAWKDGIGNDRSALGLWGTDGVNYYLIDAWADKVEYPDLKAKVKDFWNRWNDRNLAPTFWACVKTPRAVSRSSKNFDARRIFRSLASGSISRSTRVPRRSRHSSRPGKCFLPENAPWLDEWIEEHVAFQGAYDDLVDTTSGALARLTNASTLTWTVARTGEAVKETRRLGVGTVAEGQWRPGGGPPSFRKSRYGPTIAQHGALRRGAGLLIRWQPVLTGFNPLAP